MKQQPLIDGIDPTARHDEDFYATPAWQTQALLRRIAQRDSSYGLRLFEPCVGDGAIVRELPLPWWVVTNDVVVREPFLPDFLLDARRPESWDAFARLGPFDVVATNLPFDVAFDIAPHAYAHAEGLLALLLRLSWMEPTEDRGPWLRDHPPTSAIVLPRTDYRGNGKTDSVTSAWFLWDRGLGLQLPPFDFVTKDERDELIGLALIRTHGL